MIATFTCCSRHFKVIHALSHVMSCSIKAQAFQEPPVRAYCLPGTRTIGARTFGEREGSDCSGSARLLLLGGGVLTGQGFRYGTRFPQGYGLWALTLPTLGPVHGPVSLKVGHARAGVAHAR